MLLTHIQTFRLAKFTICVTKYELPIFMIWKGRGTNWISGKKKKIYLKNMLDMLQYVSQNMTWEEWYINWQLIQNYYTTMKSILEINHLGSLWLICEVI